MQRYSGPGSPYWASKGFAALMLPAAHPLWTAHEAFWIQPVSFYSATKSYVLIFTQALQQELAGTEITVQSVIPGTMSTGFWGCSGIELSTFPEDAVMSPEAAVGAALTGLDAGEAVTIPSLVDVDDWTAFEQARDKVAPALPRAAPADRYFR